ncbi:uncharacterized protein LOC129749911 [Uranotaenia lowii]|uniref:uncharacterized protein LOC129749911 n=1 Tax=Uranotaenia lowii TaxID=190385 RepID=UPI00247A6EC0|nr:uncharacterized protein LOC129749911 [Uranotaenia lowii]
MRSSSMISLLIGVILFNSVYGRTQYDLNDQTASKVINTKNGGTVEIYFPGESFESENSEKDNDDPKTTFTRTQTITNKDGGTIEVFRPGNPKITGFGGSRKKQLPGMEGENPYVEPSKKDECDI